LKHIRYFALPIIAASLIAAAPVRAAEPYVINTILSLTGRIAFVGQTQLKSLKGVEAMVNADGGIKGRPISFVAADDESSPQTAVQLANNLIAQNVPIILGSSSPNSCGAMAPLVAAKGPLLYCLANGGDPVAGGYEFLTSMSYDAQMDVTVRYFRERGWNKVATLFATDSGGQISEKALQSALALPENKSVHIVTAQHFAPDAASDAAQMAVIKGANPDVVVAWATGGAAGTMFRGEKDLGIDLPTLTSGGNLMGAFLKQYATVLPQTMIVAGVPYYGGDTNDPATKKAIAEMETALGAVGTQPDMVTISAWDPALLLVKALRELGPNANATQLRDYFHKLKAWTGINGPYDFTADPQRGTGFRNVVMVRWDVPQGKAVALSELGGAPLPNK
jgi:branched-chain amino acid transport system substrate-binding protein